MIYVITVAASGWDNVRPPEVFDPAARYLCYTDIPNLPEVPPWTYRPLYPVGEGCRTARVPKMLPHLMLPDDCEASIYIDGNLQLKRKATRIVDELLAHHDWAAHRHPCRDCIYEEADVILYHDTMEGWRQQKPGRAKQVLDETNRYRMADFPEHAGLWACGMIVRRHTEAVARLNERWWSLYAAGGERDQLSFPVARCAEGLPVLAIDGVISGDSQYVGFFYHAAWKDHHKNRPYKSERDCIREKLRQLHVITGSDGGIRYPEV